MVNPITLPQLNRLKAVTSKADVIVVPVYGTEPDTAKLAKEQGQLRVQLPSGIAKAHEKKFGSVTDLATQLGAKAKLGSTTILPGLNGQRLLLVGLGSGEPSPADVRFAAGAAARVAAGLKGVQRIGLTLPADEPELLRAVTEGALLGQYAYAPITAEPEDKPQLDFGVVTTIADNSVIDTARTLVEAQLMAREWVNLPPNLLYPETFAQAAKDLLSARQVSVDVLTESELARDGYGGHLAVGGGSSRLPRLVRISYAPPRAKAHLVLVGKGITFDSGGLNLKPGDSMATMRCDMAGAAAVIAATHAIAQLGLKVRVTTYACMAENLPSDTAFRPSDVLTLYGGKTVENYNTDAEGRLVLADGLARGAEDKPDLIVDCATLTGAAMVALGSELFGVFSDSDVVAEQILGSAESAGENAWRLPMGEWSAEALDSKVADMKSGGGRWGGASIAASFLRKFVPDEIAWAHLDIAGASFNEGSAKGEVPVGGTGVGVRTLVELARGLQG